ncbi:hypothetical protein PoB_005709000 [Plakobranchus ocellatus]|uniref:Uncharacterized protein n=1 Tax=Plakobranchus ocellatus TaxID=259542 RepID=A0AAV4CGE4_9GAST|nr:hypothetical protein PoB_005709000 [Plakobranchus ocellatus]
MMPTAPDGTNNIIHTNITKSDPEQILRDHLLLREARMLGPLGNTSGQSKSTKVRGPISALSLKDPCNMPLPCSGTSALALYHQSFGLVSRSSQLFADKLSPSLKAGSKFAPKPPRSPASPDPPGSPLQQALASRSSPGVIFHSPTPRPGDRVEDLSERRYSPYRHHRRPSSTSPTPQAQLQTAPLMQVSESSRISSPSTLPLRSHQQLEPKLPLSRLSSDNNNSRDINHDDDDDRDSNVCDTNLLSKSAQVKKLKTSSSPNFCCADTSMKQDQGEQCKSPESQPAASQSNKHQTPHSPPLSASPNPARELTPPPPLKPSLPPTAATKMPTTSNSKLSSPRQQPTPPSTSPPARPPNKPTAFSVADILDPSKFTGSSSVPRVPVWNPWRIAFPARRGDRPDQDNGKSPTRTAGERPGESAF